MNRLILIVCVVGLGGCATQYQYQSQAAADPTFVFGDRVASRAVMGSHHESFGMNIKDVDANKCADFGNVGMTSNHWMRLFPATREVRTPAGRRVAIRGGYGGDAYNCAPPINMFSPKDGATYGVDVDFVGDKCYLRIVQILENKQEVPVGGVTILPVCK